MCLYVKGYRRKREEDLTGGNIPLIAEEDIYVYKHLVFDRSKVKELTLRTPYIGAVIGTLNNIWPRWFFESRKMYKYRVKNKFEDILVGQELKMNVEELTADEISDGYFKEKLTPARLSKEKSHPMHKRRKKKEKEKLRNKKQQYITIPAYSLVVCEGIHALRSRYHFYDDDNDSLMFRAYIPKGTKYFIGDSDDIVAERIIFIK